LARHFPSEPAFRERLLRVGLTSEKLDEIIEQRLKMEKYLDFRFRNFVVISQKEIADYYRDVYVRRFQSRFPGRIVPTVEQAREEIEKTLMEAKIESDTDAFLETARDFRAARLAASRTSACCARLRRTISPSIMSRELRQVRWWAARGRRACRWTRLKTSGERCAGVTSDG
jgi:hypothetical protein